MPSSALLSPRLILERRPHVLWLRDIGATQGDALAAMILRDVGAESEQNAPFCSL